MDDAKTEMVEMADADIQLAVFKVAGELYAIDIMRIKEIIKPVKITPMPDVPDFIKGVINLRGMLLPVVSMRERFGFPAGELTMEARVIIVSFNKLVVGILVDCVEEIIAVPLKDVQLPPKIAKGMDSEYLKGLCKANDDVLLILDLEKILTTVKKLMMDRLKNQNA